MTRQESRAQTRERLLEAANLLFARGGYGGASVDAIAAQAGYSKGAFYSNFDSKEAIFLELLARHMAAEAAQLERFVGGSAEAAFDSLDSWLDRMNDDLDWALLTVELQLHARRSPRFAEAYDALHLRHRARLGELIARLFALCGKRVPAPAPELAGGLMALTQGLALQRTQRGAADPAGALIKLMLRGLIDSASPA